MHYINANKTVFVHQLSAISVTQLLLLSVI